MPLSAIKSLLFALFKSFVFIIVFGGLCGTMSEKVDAAWYSTDWEYRKKITVDNTKVIGDTDLLGFSLLVSVTDSQLGTFAQSDADDILFTAADGTTQLDHQVEKYNSTTGNLVVWVEVPTLDYDQNTDIYMYYGNATIGSQQDITGTWSIDYKMVQHFAEDPSISTDGRCGGGAYEACDSTGNNNHANAAVSMTAGDRSGAKIGDGYTFDGSADNLEIADHSSIDFEDGQYTFSGWFLRTSYDTDDVILAKRNTVESVEAGYILYIDDANDTLIFEAGDGSESFKMESSTTFTASSWNHFAVVWDDDSGTTSEIYINGTDDNATKTGVITAVDSGGNGLNLKIASQSDDEDYWHGRLDEIRIVGTSHSADWIETEYNNYDSPGTFYTYGTQEIVPPGYEQVAYRWFENANSTDVGSPLAAQNTEAYLSGVGEQFRLRTLVHVLYSGILTSSQFFKLQFAEMSGICDTSFVGETYADVTTTSKIAYYDNSSPEDGVALVPNVNDPTHGGDTIIPQTYEELNNATNSQGSIAEGEDGKWDFSLYDNGVSGGKSYCLRMVENDGTALEGYDVIPQITFYPKLTFGISAVGAGTLTNGVTTTRASTDNTLPFGHIAVDELTYMAHQLYVQTNAEAGYTVTVRIDPGAFIQGLDPANVIDPFAATSVSWSNPLPWTSPTGTVSNVNSGWIGANTSDTRVNGWSDGSGKFGPLTYAQSYPVMTATSPDAGTYAYVTYALEVNVYQPTDLYSGNVIYTVIPTY